MIKRQNKGLNEYLRKEYKNMGVEWVKELLSSPLEAKLKAKATIERAKVMGLMLYRSHVTGSLAPPISFKKERAKPDFEARYSSYEAGFRAILLPHNVYFIQDAMSIREVLGLPESGVEPVLPERISRNYEWWLEQAPLDVLILSNAWEAIHTCKIRKTAYSGPELPPFIPRFITDYLTSNDPVPNLKSAPAWLKKQPAFLWGKPNGYQEDLPLHQFTAILMNRYGLTPDLFWGIRYYLFSNKIDDLRFRVAGKFMEKLKYPGLPVSVEYIPQRTADGNTLFTLSITAYAIDAITTPDDWNSIWRECIEPVQRTWRERVASEEFMKKVGRYPSLEECKELILKLKQRAKRRGTLPITYLPIWDRMKQNGCSIDQALNDLALQELDFDWRNAQRAVLRFEKLMHPQEW